MIFFLEIVSIFLKKSLIFRKKKTCTVYDFLSRDSEEDRKIFKFSKKKEREKVADFGKSLILVTLKFEYKWRSYKSRSNPIFSTPPHPSSIIVASKSGFPVPRRASNYPKLATQRATSAFPRNISRAPSGPRIGAPFTRFFPR